MTKTLDEILSRNDYVRLTAALKDRVVVIARKIRGKIQELDIDVDPNYTCGEIEVDGVILRVRTTRARGKAPYCYLAIACEGECFKSLEDIGSSYYYAGDFNAKVEGASNKDALRFLNASKHIIEALDEIETKQVAAIEKALDENKDM